MLFWWPITGTAFAGGQIPEVSHWTISVVLELLGVAAAVWIWRRFGLAEPMRRRQLLRDGRLDLPSA